LRRGRLVKTRRESQTIYYRIADPGVSKIIGALYELYCAPKGAPQAERKRK
jgi:DNA-binding transcriptional ArsR family regulator